MERDKWIDRFLITFLANLSVIYSTWILIMFLELLDKLMGINLPPTTAEAGLALAPLNCQLLQSCCCMQGCRALSIFFKKTH